MGCFSSPSTSVKAHQTLTGRQQTAQNALLDYLQPQIGQTNPYEFQGNRVAEGSPLTAAGLNMLSQTPQYTGQLAQQGMAGIANLLNPQNANSGLGAIFGRGQDMFGRESDRIAAQFGEANATSSSGARDAQLRALEQFTLASQAQAAPLGLQSILGGLGAIPGMAALPGETATGLFQGGQLQQSQQQALINEQIAAAQRQNPAFNPALQMVSSAVETPAFENIGIPRAQGIGASILGGLGSINVGK